MTSIIAHHFDPVQCHIDDCITIVVQEGCDELLTDSTHLVDVMIDPPEFQQTVRLLSGCQQFSVHIDTMNTYRLVIDGQLLCTPLAANGLRFPCVTKQGIVCQTVTQCACHIEVQLVYSDESCNAAGYYVDIRNRQSTTQLRWHVHSDRKMAYTTDINKHMHHENEYSTGLLMDITNDGTYNEINCKLQITQIIVTKHQIIMPQAISVSVTSSSCLVKRTYFDDISLKRKSHCFK